MKQYEVPYNFAYDFYTKLRRRADPFPYVKCIYLPSFEGKNTRYDATLQDGYPKTKKEYELRLKALQQLGLPLCILMQKEATMGRVEEYYSMGIRMVILNDDSLASEIHRKHPKVTMILSITRAITVEEIQNTDLSMYDEIVLFFWFNRHLTEVKNLPKKYRYVLIPNNDCYYKCRWHDAHWFADSLEEMNAATSKCRACIGGLRDTTYIEPENLAYFDPYIDSYKLVDRLNPTDRILEDLDRYAHRNIGAVQREEDWYNAAD